MSALIEQVREAIAKGCDDVAIGDMHSSAPEDFPPLTVIRLPAVLAELERLERARGVIAMCDDVPVAHENEEGHRGSVTSGYPDPPEYACDDDCPECAVNETREKWSAALESLTREDVAWAQAKP